MCSRTGGCKKWNMALFGSYHPIDHFVYAFPSRLLTEEVTDNRSLKVHPTPNPNMIQSDLAISSDRSPSLIHT